MKAKVENNLYPGKLTQISRDDGHAAYLRDKWALSWPLAFHSHLRHQQHCSHCILHLQITLLHYHLTHLWVTVSRTHPNRRDSDWARAPRRHRPHPRLDLEQQQEEREELGQPRVGHLEEHIPSDHLLRLQIRGRRHWLLPRRGPRV